MPSSSVYFEYVGKTGMSAVGPATGKSYRFDHPGARVEVDSRDRLLLALVPNLRLVVPR
jgi:hypothetical protein